MGAIRVNRRARVGKRRNGVVALGLAAACLGVWCAPAFAESPAPDAPPAGTTSSPAPDAPVASRPAAAPAVTAAPAARTSPVASARATAPARTAARTAASTPPVARKPAPKPVRQAERKA